MTELDNLYPVAALVGTDDEGFTLVHATGLVDGTIGVEAPTGATPQQALEAVRKEAAGETYSETEIHRQRAEAEEGGEYASGGFVAVDGFAMPCASRQPFRMFADFTGVDRRYRDSAPEAGTVPEPIMSGSDGAMKPVVVGHGSTITSTNTHPVAIPSYDEQRAEQQKAGVAMRFNAGKLRFDLVPPDAFEELVKIFTMGAAKYADRNWEKGFDWMSCAASLKRHLNDWEKGIDHDPESTYLHMAHVMWNAMALTTFQLRGVGKDDRVKLVPLD